MTTMTPAQTDKYEIAAKAHLAGVDHGRWVRLTAAQQRDIFGAYLFGKKSLRISTDGQGSVEYVHSVCYGTDFSGGVYSLERIAEAVNGGHRLTF